MNTKLKWTLIFSLTAFLAACDSDTENEEDCSVEADGTVQIFYPKGGEVFHLGDEITVKYGAKNSNGSGFRILYFFDEDSFPVELTEESVGIEAPKGDRCYTEKVVLGGDNFPTSDAAHITIRDYSDPDVVSNSKSFQVIE